MSSSHAAGSRPGFRPDIEGLRAVAVGLVVLGHAGLPGLAGGYVGVDVFFVISGFLITTLLVRELTTRGSISIAGFYARRALRLLPASTVVLVATLTAAWLWLPPVRFPSIVGDTVAATLYGINYRLAVQGTDYLTADAAPSPVQHFWSLAVEEQFYLLWPLLLLATAGRRRGRHRLRRAPIVIALLLLTAASFAASVVQTGRSAPWAYFGAHTRAWELGVGALLALATGLLARSPRRLAAALSWLGLAGVLAAALLFDERTAFPGATAALPVAGAALVVAGGCAPHSGGAGLLLNTAGAQLVGRLSYGWYLWHWPVLVIAPVALGLAPTLPLHLGLVAAALLAAAASYRWVEAPIRSRGGLRTRPSRGLGLGVALSGSAAALALLAGALPAPTSGGAEVADTRERLTTSDRPAAELAALLAAGTTAVPANLTPALDAAKRDRSPAYADGCHLDFATVEPRDDCRYGDPDGRQTVVLFGDSHAAQWLPALDVLGERLGWSIVSHTKSGCPAPSVTLYNATVKRSYTECTRWRERALRRIADAAPAMVVLASKGGDSGGLADPPPGEADQVWAEAWRSTLRRLDAPSTKLVVIADTPLPAQDVPECVSSHLADVSPCAREVGEALLEPRRRALTTAVARDEGATVIDPTDWFCHAGSCPPIIGNTLVYTDASHISATWSRLLAPILAASLPLGR